MLLERREKPTEIEKSVERVRLVTVLGMKLMIAVAVMAVIWGIGADIIRTGERRSDYIRELETKVRHMETRQAPLGLNGER